MIRDVYSGSRIRIRNTGKYLVDPYRSWTCWDKDMAQGGKTEIRLVFLCNVRKEMHLICILFMRILIQTFAESGSGARSKPVQDRKQNLAPFWLSKSETTNNKCTG
jgi:hypothetical protein